MIIWPDITTSAATEIRLRLILCRPAVELCQRCCRELQVYQFTGKPNLLRVRYFNDIQRSEMNFSSVYEVYTSS